MNSYKPYYCVNCGKQLTMGILDRYQGGRCETCGANYSMVFTGAEKVASLTIQYFEQQEGYVPKRWRL
jgi:DNA-directed RNA polymerase subunit RPC12/RpoP